MTTQDPVGPAVTEGTVDLEDRVGRLEGEVARLSRRRLRLPARAKDSLYVKWAVGGSAIAAATASVVLFDLHKYGWAIVATIVSALLALAHYLVDRRLYFPPRLPVSDTDPEKHGITRKQIERHANRFARTMTVSQASDFINALLDPTVVRARTRESITPRTRVYRRVTQMNVRVSSNKPIYLPIVRLRKGELQDQRSVSDASGSRLQTLTFAETCGLAIAVIRYLMAGADRLDVDGDDSRNGLTALDQYLLTLDGSVIRVISRRARLDDKSLRAKKGTLKSLKKLAAQCVEPPIVLWAESIVHFLSMHYPIIALVEPDEDGRVLLTIDEHVIPHDVRNLEGERFGVRGLSGAAAEWLRSLLGTRPARYTVDLRHAKEARSYHMEFTGPDGTYLSRQRVVEVTREQIRNFGAYDRWRGRHGQRYAHLYLRAASKIPSDLSARLSFIERPPGSLGAATVASGAATLLLGVGSQFSSDVEVGATLALAALLLAFPAVASVWAGFESSMRVAGSMFIARLTSIVTLLLCSLGVIASFNAPDMFPTLFDASLLMTLWCGYWWVVRVKTYSRILAKPPGSIEPSYRN